MGVFTHGGRRDSGRSAGEWAREVADRGAGELLLTSMDRDGTGLGYDLKITGRLAHELPISVIASGGAQTPQHLLDAFRAKADAVLAATMFHSGAYSIGATKQFLARGGVSLRLSDTPNDLGEIAGLFERSHPC